MCFGIHLRRIEVGAIVPVSPKKHFRGNPTLSAVVLECTRIAWILSTGLHSDVPVAKLLEEVSRG